MQHPMSKVRTRTLLREHLTNPSKHQS
jgi:hypothetical protein